LQSSAPAQVQIIAGNISDSNIIAKLVNAVQDKELHGMVVNAGGPPAKTVLETSLEDWDDAYKNILRWKVAITQAIVPKMIGQHYGRIVYIESSSVKQPLENLVLSNSLRVAVVGMVKTLSQEIAGTGVTLNILGPGSHNTPAIDRIYQKKSEQQIPVGALGEADDFASLALWLLSPMSRYVTGETITVDGGMVKSML